MSRLVNCAFRSTDGMVRQSLGSTIEHTALAPRYAYLEKRMTDGRRGIPQVRRAAGLNDKEQKNASARHQEVRDYLATKFEIERSFLTGSYERQTKTKPLKDIDIFFVLQAVAGTLSQQGAVGGDR